MPNEGCIFCKEETTLRVLQGIGIGSFDDGITVYHKILAGIQARGKVYGYNLALRLIDVLYDASIGSLRGAIESCTEESINNNMLGG